MDWKWTYRKDLDLSFIKGSPQKLQSSLALVAGDVCCGWIYIRIDPFENL